MDTPHVNLIIATPGHSVISPYVKCLLATAQELNKREITWAWSSEYSSHVADAREMTLNGGPENDPSDSRPFKGTLTYDKILWIDSDIIFTPDDVVKMYESDKDIVSGAYLLSDGTATAYKELFGPGFTFEEVKSMTDPVQIHSAGFGFICMKQGIFEKMSRPWFQSVIGTNRYKDENYTFPIMGEDISMCHRIGQMGYEIWLDPTVRLIHQKTMKLTWEGPMP